MKKSKFNTAVNFESLVVLHNSFTNKFLLLEQFLYDIYNSISTKEEIVELRNIHPDFYDALINNGFFVEDAVDELEQVKNLINTVDNQEDYYHLIVNPTMNCNFKCWYCYETHEKKSQLNDETIYKIERLIENIFLKQPKIKYIVLSFFGGEPLLFYDKMIKLIRGAKTIADKYGKEMHLAATTNGLLINDNIINELSTYKIAGFQITLDGNKDKHDKVRFISKSKGSYDKIITNIKALANKGIFVTLRINYTRENLNGLEEVIYDLDNLESFAKRNIALSMQKVFQEPNTQELSDLVERFKFFAKERGIKHRSDLLSDTVRNSCYADKKNQAVINYNGDVYKCNARDFNQKNKEGVLNDFGEILWNEQHNKRLIPKMTNKPCLECSILPICGGGCSQMIVENIGKDYCMHNFDENSKKEMVLSMFLDEELL